MKAARLEPHGPMMESGEAMPDGRRTKVRNALTAPNLHPLYPPNSMLEYAADPREDQVTVVTTLNKRGVKGYALWIAQVANFCPSPVL